MTLAHIKNCIINEIRLIQGVSLEIILFNKLTYRKNTGNQCGIWQKHSQL